MTPMHNGVPSTLCSWLWSPPEVLRNMTFWGFSARETAAVTSAEFKTTEQPWTSLPTGHTNGIVPQPRLHWRRLLSTLMEGGALRRSNTREWDGDKGEFREALATSFVQKVCLSKPEVCLQNHKFIWLLSYHKIYCSFGHALIRIPSVGCFEMQTVRQHESAKQKLGD